MCTWCPLLYSTCFSKLWPQLNPALHFPGSGSWVHVHGPWMGYYNSLPVILHLPPHAPLPSLLGHFLLFVLSFESWMPIPSSLDADGPISHFTEDIDTSWREATCTLLTTSVSTVFSFVTSDELSVLLRRLIHGMRSCLHWWTHGNWSPLLSVLLHYSLPCHWITTRSLYSCFQFSCLKDISSLTFIPPSVTTLFLCFKAEILLLWVYVYLA